jgi:non-ribosomal peptide synthetase component F
VAGADESWTYRELHGASNRLAGLLSRKNIHPGDVVAIYAHRDPTLAVAILAALKAGAVFVILDPAYPAPRLIDYVRIARPKGWLRMAGAGALPRQLAEFLRTSEIRCLIDLPPKRNNAPAGASRRRP